LRSQGEVERPTDSRVYESFNGDDTFDHGYVFYGDGDYADSGI